MSSDSFVYRLEGHLTRGEVIGPVSDGFRADNHFEGRITAGALTGAHVRLVDYFRVRPDGIGVVDAREIMTVGDGTVSIAVRGQVLPPAGLPVPTAEQMASPDFAWPDADFTIQAIATFETSDADLAHLNGTAVVHSGAVNMATGALVVDAHRFPDVAA